MDGSLEDEDLIMISDLNENQFKKLSPSYQKLIHEHSTESGKLFDLIFPNETQTKALIENHHGPQFEKNFKELVQAGDKGTDLCIFSIAQYLSQEILKNNLNISDLKKNLKQLENLYPKTKILDSVKKLA